jgi:hypothetical protein
LGWWRPWANSILRDARVLNEVSPLSNLLASN